MAGYNRFLGAFLSGDDGKSGYNAGFRNSRLAALAKEQDPLKQAEISGQLASVDPQAAQAWNDDSVKQAATMLATLGKDNPIAQQAWQKRIKPNLVRQYGEQAASLPDIPDDSIIAYAQQIAGGGSGRPKARSSHILADGTIAFMDEYGNLTKTGEKASNSYGFQTDAEGNVYAQDKRGGSIARAPMGSVQAGPQPATGDPMAPHLERIATVQQAMKDANVPVEQINAWSEKAFADAQAKVGANGAYEEPPAPAQARVSVKPDKVDVPSGYRQLPDGSLAPIPGGPADPSTKDSAPKITAINSIRGDYTRAVQPQIDVMTAYEKMRVAAQDPSPAGDIALLYAYMKILDPTSVVREGEFATAQNAASVPESVRNQWNRIVSGERIAVNRGDFLNQGAKLYAGAKGRYSQIRQQYQGIAQRNNIDTRDVLVDGHVPISQKFPAKGSAGKYTKGQVLVVNGKKYKVVGGDPSDPELEEMP